MLTGPRRADGLTDLEYLARLGIPLDNIARRAGVSVHAIRRELGLPPEPRTEYPDHATEPPDPEPGPADRDG